MKTLLAICLIVAASFATSVGAGEMSALIPPYTSILTGDVLAIKDVDIYPYPRPESQEGEAWVAVGQADELKDMPLRVGGKVVKYNSGIMEKNWIDLRTDKDFGSGDSCKVFTQETTKKV
ncbi:hypothetical protein [Rhodoferax sp.]|uniref:hypothetical protein n=1 Tax=Rhodoferax sp. TaxID=50421 RepID=UPI00374D40DB